MFCFPYTNNSTLLQFTWFLSESGKQPPEKQARNSVESPWRRQKSKSLKYLGSPPEHSALLSGRQMGRPQTCRDATQRSQLHRAWCEGTLQPLCAASVCKYSTESLPHLIPPEILAQQRCWCGRLSRRALRRCYKVPSTFLSCGVSVYLQWSWGPLNQSYRPGR